MKVVLFCGTLKYLWAVRPFLYLFNKYWGKQTTVLLFSVAKPDFELPGNVELILFPDSMLINGELPLGRFTDAHLWFLEQLHDEVFVYFLPDHWIVAPVDLERVETLYRYTLATPLIVRMNLGYRIGVSQMARSVDTYEGLDITECVPNRGELKISLTPCFFRTKLLHDLLHPGQDPWRAESYATGMIHDMYPTYRSMATRPELVDFWDVCSHTDQSPRPVRLSHFSLEDVEALLPMIPAGWIAVGIGEP
jgi:hypothetical protein